MKMNREKYVELHSLDFDHENSACGSCPLDECGYYYGNCPQEEGKLIATNAFSGSMVSTEKYGTEVTKISEEEFNEMARFADSHISHPGISKRYHLPINKKQIHLVPGDEVLVVYIHGGKLPMNGKVPWNVKLSFEHIKVVA